MNENVYKIEISGIRKFYNKVALVPDAISLTLGQPDFSVPSGVKRAMVRAIEENKTGYTSNAGIPELRRAISRYLEGFSIYYNPDEICITVGGSQGLFSVFNALLNRGDKVVIPDPAYPAYESIVKLLGGEVLKCDLQKDFTVNIAKLEEIIEEQQPKIIVLSYPSNPTGATMSKTERDKIYEIVKNRDIYIITDEIYSAITFEGDYFSIAQLEEIREKVILVSGFSKMFSMTGLRIGYVCACSNLMKELIKVHQYNVSCAPSVAQWGAYEGLTNCMADVGHMRNEFLKRRDYVYGRLQSIGMDVVLPKGAFYIFPSIEQFGIGSEEFCDRLLTEGKVAVVPGNAFGKNGDRNIRISYSYSMEELSRAFDRFEQWVNRKIK